MENYSNSDPASINRMSFMNASSVVDICHTPVYPQELAFLKRLEESCPDIPAKYRFVESDVFKIRTKKLEEEITRLDQEPKQVNHLTAIYLRQYVNARKHARR